MLKVSRFSDLFKPGCNTCEIVCAVKGEVVRRLRFDPVNVEVEIDPIVGDAVFVSPDAPIRFEPWFMDRGSLTFFSCDLGDRGKLCTELDLVRWPDGTEAPISHSK